MGECVNCVTEKGRPAIRGESSGSVKTSNLSFPDNCYRSHPLLPRSFIGNTELLLWVDIFSGYVTAKASLSRTSQTITEIYEECVFRRFGASKAIRHDREPGFMSDLFRAFNQIAGQKQRATMAYRSESNGITERMVQTLTRAL